MNFNNCNTEFTAPDGHIFIRSLVMFDPKQLEKPVVKRQIAQKKTKKTSIKKDTAVYEHENHAWLLYQNI